MRARFLTAVLVSFLSVILVPTVGTPTLAQDEPDVRARLESAITQLQQQNHLLKQTIERLLAGPQPFVGTGRGQPLPPGPGHPMELRAQPRPPQEAGWQAPLPQPPIGRSYKLTVEVTRFEGDAAEPVLSGSTVVTAGREFHLEVGFEHAAPAEQGSQSGEFQAAASLELGGLCAPRDDGGITFENLRYEMGSQMSAGEMKAHARVSGQLTMPMYPGTRTTICVLGLPGDQGKPGARIEIQALLSQMATEVIQ